MYDYNWIRRIKDALRPLSWTCILMVWLLGYTHGQASANADLGGIPNLGNTCYLNATMQVIAKLYPRTFESSNIALARAGKVIVDKIKVDSSSVTRAEAKAFLDALARTGWPKGGSDKNSQQDAEEVFSHMMNCLKASKPIQLWQLFEYSPVNGQRKVENFTQDKIRNEKPGYYILSMIAGLSKADASQNKSLQAYVDAFLEKEKVEYRDARPNTAYKSYKIQNPPRLFAIQAKRFIWENRASHKAREHIAKPLSFVLKAKYQHSLVRSTLQDVSYQLEAFVVHHGSSMHRGYYTTYIKRNGQWKHYDDEKVSNVDNRKAEAAARQAYLYFFCRTS